MAAETAGFAGADLRALCSAAAMAAVHRCAPGIVEILTADPVSSSCREHQSIIKRQILLDTKVLSVTLRVPRITLEAPDADSCGEIGWPYWSLHTCHVSTINSTVIKAPLFWYHLFGKHYEEPPLGNKLWYHILNMVMARIFLLVHLFF